MARKRGKKYLNALKQIDTKKAYSVEDAVELMKKTDFAKFDATVSVVFNLNVDTKQADQQLRGAVVLPNGTGKKQTVIAFAKDAHADAAKKAGADYVGGKDLAEKIQKGWLDFDVAVATPDMMPIVGRLGRILGPKGLMPNPKTGTVTMKVGQAVKDAKSGKVTYRTDRDGNVAVMIGKVSFDAKKLAQNFKTISDIIVKSRPQSVKGDYIENVSISSTFGPGIKVDINK